MELPVLTITPDKTLEFETIPGAQAQVILRLENPHDRNVAFKIKTTAPKSYLVKPSAGVIVPRETQMVNIHLIPQFDNKQSNTDRFLVQSSFVETNAPVSRDAWANIPKHKLDERKLGVVITYAKAQGKSSSGGTAAICNSDSAELTFDPLKPFVTKPIPDDFNNLKAHFDELLAVAVSLERQVKELSAANDRANMTGATGQKKYIGGSSLDLWHVALILPITIIILKLFHFL